MSTPEPEPNTKALETIIVSKELAARGQLETAIGIWFNYGDPVSILNLAHAANDCYRAIGAHKGHESIYNIWFENQSNGFQKRICFILNWIKHGLKKLTKTIELPPRLGEILILDSIDCHQHLFGRETALMGFFLTRFGLENPRIAKFEVMALLREQLKVYDLTDGDRTQFLNKALERWRIVMEQAPIST